MYTILQHRLSIEIMAKKSSSKSKKPTKNTNSKVKKAKRENKKPENKAQKPVQSKVQSSKSVKTTTKSQTPVTETKKQQPAANAGVTRSSGSLQKALAKEEVRNRVYAVLFGTVFIGLTIALVFVWIPNVVKNTDDYKAIEERERLAQQEAEDAQRETEQAQQRAQQIEQENADLTFENQLVTMSTSFGDMVIDLSYPSAPATVENFVRLTYRGFYDDQSIHRMVETDGFNVIQGGQAGEDQSGEAALGGTVVDELWEVAPIYDQSETGESILTNEPVLRQPALAQDFNAEQGTILYPKGTILMAKTSQPDSATTQFFITLTDTILPAQYTPFGVVTDETETTLDRILNEVDPDNTNGEGDGAPNQEIRYTIRLN